MSYPMTTAQAANSNTWDAQLYKEAFDLKFARDLEDKLAINLITNFVPGNYTTRIERPIASLGGATIKDEVSCVRGTINAADTGIEVFERKDRYYDNYKYCPDNVKRTKTDVAGFVAEYDYLIKERLMKAMDKDAVDIAIANASTTIGAVTDAATAQAALDAVTVKYSGKTGEHGIVGIVPSTLMPFFRELGVTRITNLGDVFFTSGTLFDIFGVKLRVVDASNLTDPTKVLFVIDKPVHFYYDKMSFGVTEIAQTPDVAAGEYVNTNYIREILVEGDFHVWSNDQEHITVTA